MKPFSFHHRLAAPALSLLFAVAAPNAIATLTLADAYAPHYAGNTVRIAVSANAANNPLYIFESGYDVFGNYYTWGCSGIFSISSEVRNPSTNQLYGSRLLEMDGHPDDYNGPVDTDAFLAPGSYRFDVAVDAANYEDGHWYDDGWYDENGNWVSNGAAWTGGGTWSAGTIASDSLTFPVDSGGSTPQTITWTSSPPPFWPWNNTIPFALGAITSSGRPVSFQVIHLAGNLGYMFGLSGAQLSYCGSPYPLIVGQTSFTVRARVAADATYAYAASDIMVNIDRAAQNLSLKIPNQYNAAATGLLGSVSGWGGMAPLTFQLTAGTGVDHVTGTDYYPGGGSGMVTIGVQAAGDSYYYYPSAFVTSTFQVGPFAAPSIVTQPADQTLFAGQTATLHVDATGIPSPTWFQWSKNGVAVGVATSHLSGSGITAADYTITNAQTSDSGSYTVLITTSAGSVTSAAATLTVNPPPPPSAPTITTQPASIARQVGQSATFTAAATGWPLPAYQWRKDGVAISDATSASYTVSNIQVFHAGNYTIVVSNSQGSVTSNAAVLTISPTLTTPPANATILVGQSATFTAGVAAAPTPTFRWFKNGTLLAGATNSTLTITNATVGDSASYAFTAENAGGTASASATLTVLTTGVPAIATQPSPNPQAIVGGGISLSVSATGMPPLSYRWKKNGVPMSDGSTCYGATLPTLQMINLQSSDTAYYQVEVSNAYGSVISNISFLMVFPEASAPVITAQPQSTSVSAGDTVTFSAAASGTPTPTYQWWKDGVIIQGATNTTLTLTNVQTSAVGRYTLVAINFMGSAASDTALVTVTAPPALAGAPPVITTHPDDQTVVAGSTVSFSVTASGTEPLVYQWFKNNIVISGATGVTLTLNNVQIADTGSYFVEVSNGIGRTTSVPGALMVTTGAPMAPAITLQPTNITAELGSTVQLEVVASGNPAPAYTWLWNGQPLGPSTKYTGENRSRLTLFHLNNSPGAEGNTGEYSVIVSNSVGSPVTSQSVAVAVVASSSNLVPEIVQHPQPAEQRVGSGTNVTLAVEARGVGPLHYQWFRNGVEVDGATNAVLSFVVGAAESAFGYYRAEVTNGFGMTSSEAAIVRPLQQSAHAAYVPLSLSSVAAQLNVPFQFQLYVDDPELGMHGIKASWLAFGLPYGLSIGPTDGVISGTPVSVAGEFPVSYQATLPSGVTLNGQIVIGVLSTESKPWVWGQPADARTLAGYSTQFQVYAVTVASPLTYQWYKNGNPVAGATDSQLTFAQAQSSEVGNYYVVVTNPKGSVQSQAVSLTLGSVFDAGSPPVAEFVFPIRVKKPDGSEFQINEQNGNATDPVTRLNPVGSPAIAATVGDTITITARSTDVDGDLGSRVVTVIAPEVTDATASKRRAHPSATSFWVNPLGSATTGNKLIYYFPADDPPANPPAREVKFVLDAPGVWTFQVQATDLRLRSSGFSSRSQLSLQVSNPVLSKGTNAITHASRLVGAYFNPGQVHRSYVEMWRPRPGRWDFKWGPNPVVPLRVDWSNPDSPAKATIRDLQGSNYSLGWAERFGLAAQEDWDIARDMAAELSYCGVDFVILDHTNLVFAYGTNPLANEHRFTNTDNQVMRSAVALREGFKTYATATGKPRIKMTFMLGLTTAWFDEKMERSHPADQLPIKTHTYRWEGGKVVWDDPTIEAYLAGRTVEFNGVLQKIWDEFAKDPDVWQKDPGNGDRPLLLLYVGTDGPAIFRDALQGKLSGATPIPFDIGHPLCWKIRKATETVDRPINEVFSIKYVAAGMASGWALDQPYLDDQKNPAEQRTVLPFRGRVSQDWPTSGQIKRRYYNEHWSFRENPENLDVAPVGTLSPDKTKVEAVHVTAYRMTSEDLFGTQLQVVVSEKPRWLILDSWNEFGSANDEPSPEGSWTIMPNNKYGRRYSEIVRDKVKAYKEYQGP